MSLVFILTLVTIITCVAYLVSGRLKLSGPAIEVLRLGFMILFFVLMLVEFHPLLVGMRL